MSLHTVHVRKANIGILSVAAGPEAQHLHPLRRRVLAVSPGIPVYAELTAVLLLKGHIQGHVILPGVTWNRIAWMMQLVELVIGAGRRVNAM